MNSIQYSSFAHLCWRHLVKMLIVVVIGASTFFAVGAYAQEDPDRPAPELSLSTIILFALNNNPEVGQADARAAQTGYAVEEAKSALYPKADVSVLLARDLNDPAGGDEIEPGQSDVTGTTKVNISVEQMLFDGFSTREKIKQREKLYGASFVQTELVRQKVISDTIQAYLSIYRGQNVYRETKSFLRRMRNINEKIEIMAEAGAASQAKVSYARSRLANARTQMQNTAAELNDAVSELEFLTGKLPPFTTRRPEELSPAALDIDFYLDMASRKNKDIQLNEMNKEAAEHQLKSEEGKYFPDLSWGIGVDQSNNDGGEVGTRRDISTRLEVSYNLFDGFQKKNVTNRVKSQITELDYKRQTIIKGLKREIKQSYNQIVSIESNIAVTEDEIMSNKDVRRLNYEKFELGDIDIIELIEGEERLNIAIAKRYDLMVDLYTNTFELLELVGALQRESFCGSC